MGIDGKWSGCKSISCLDTQLFRINRAEKGRGRRSSQLGATYEQQLITSTWSRAKRGRRSGGSIYPRGEGREGGREGGRGEGVER